LRKRVFLKSPVRENRTPGSVRGLSGNWQSYRDDEEDTASALHDLIDRENVDLVILNAHGYTQGIYWPYSSLALSFIAYGAEPLLIVQDLSPGELEQTQAEIAARESGGH